MERVCNVALNASLYLWKPWWQITHSITASPGFLGFEILTGFHHPSICPPTEIEDHCTFSIPAVAGMNFNVILIHCSCRLLLLLLAIAAMQEWSCQMAARLPLIWLWTAWDDRA